MYRCLLAFETSGNNTTVWEPYIPVNCYDCIKRALTDPQIVRTVIQNVIPEDREEDADRYRDKALRINDPSCGANRTYIEETGFDIADTFDRVEQTHFTCPNTEN